MHGCGGLCAAVQRRTIRAGIARLVQRGRRCACAEAALARCRDESTLKGKMSEASLMSCTSGWRRGNFSAHSSSALSEIALKRSFFSGTAAAMSMDASASDDTSMEASTSCIHTPAVARAARPVEMGANVDSCSAVASAGRRNTRSIFEGGRTAPTWTSAGPRMEGRITPRQHSGSCDQFAWVVRSKHKLW